MTFSLLPMTENPFLAITGIKSIPQELFLMSNKPFIISPIYCIFCFLQYPILWPFKCIDFSLFLMCFISIYVTCYSIRYPIQVHRTLTKSSVYTRFVMANHHEQLTFYKECSHNINKCLHS